MTPAEDVASSDAHRDLSDIKVALARMETKLDAVIVGHGDHEARIRRLERVAWLATGAGAVGGTGAGAVVAKLIGG